MGNKFWLRCATGEQDGGESGSETGGDTFTPITTQDELNKVIQERVKRERGKYADYQDLKTKAAELDRLKAENQTEAEKSTEQITTLQQQLEQMQLTTMRAKIQAKHGISDDDAELFLTGTDEDTLNRQATALAERTEQIRKKGPIVPSQKNHPTDASDDPAKQFTRDLFGRTS
jgi:hypothetical protein